MNAKLIIVGGKANKSEIALRLPTVIGRSRDADLTMAHPMVSRRHCELYEEGGLLKIRDLGSLNGTFVGEDQVREADLYPDTQFTVGPLTFRVQYDYSAGAAPAPPPGVADAGEPAFVEPEAAPPASSETERQTVDDQADFVEVEQRPAEPWASEPAPVSPADEPVGIAPSDGEMPDFAAWDAMEQGSGEPQSADEAAPDAEPLDDAEPPIPPPPGPAEANQEDPTAQLDAPEVPVVPDADVAEPVEADFGASFSEAETERPNPAEEESAPELPPAGRPPTEAEAEDEPVEPDDGLDEFLKGLK